MAKKQLFILLLILVLGAFLRFYQFTKTDVITDEASLAIRAIGLIDFDSSPIQSSPWQWVDRVPSWLHLSMNDHPLGFFLTSHLFFSLFGINIWGLRLATILFGLLSLYLTYLIGKKLFNNSTGLTACLIMALTTYHVWISRLGLQESLLIAVMLLSFYFFLLSWEKEKNLLWFFIFLGLSLFVKYTALISLPLYFIIALSQKKILPWLKNKYFYFGLLIFIIILCPSFVYNLKMQQTFGHLDFQLSAAFGQNVPEWQIRLGREMAGGLQQRINEIVPQIKAGTSWPLFILFLTSFFALIWQWLKNIKQPENRSNLILLTTLIFWLLWFFIIGAELRFISCLIPFLALTASWFIIFIWSLIKKSILKRLFFVLLIFIFFSELFFTLNTIFISPPLGQKNIFWSPIYYEIKDWGLHDLDNYLNRLLLHQTPALSFSPRYQFLQTIKDKNLARTTKNNYRKFPALIVYDANLNDMAALWLFHRRVIYQSWPIITADDFLNIINNQELPEYQKTGITKFYFIALTNNSYLRQQDLTKSGKNLEIIMEKNNILPVMIYNKNNQPVFKIYQFNEVK